jgi:membrane-associated phospholipid phosphatase
MNIASLIGLYTAVYWKGFYRRVRPGQLLPALMPPISVPGHSAFPSGHATQSWLISLCVQQALPGFVLQTGPSPGPGTPTPGSLCETLTPGLTELAKRIARNREIAGLHYPTDTVGGQTLAAGLFGSILSNTATPPLPKYAAVLAAAKAEWP